MKLLIGSIPVLFVLFTAGQLVAGSVVGSVDKEGNVTFSDTAPANAVESETINLQPNVVTSESRAEANQQEASEMVREADAAAQSREAARMADESSAAESRRSIAEAEANLEAAKVVGPGDRRGMAGGGSRLTPEYHERVQQAQDALDNARSGQ